MIRLTVEQLYLLREAIERSGQAHATVLPLSALGSHRLIVAWAKPRTRGQGLYLSVWHDSKSWEDAVAQDRAGENLPFDFLNDAQTAEYTHTYPAENQMDVEEFTTRLAKIVGAADSGHPEFGVPFGE